MPHRDGTPVQLTAADLRKAANYLTDFAASAESGMTDEVLALSARLYTASSTAVVLSGGEVLRHAELYLQTPAEALAGYSDDEQRARDEAADTLAMLVVAASAPST